MPTIVYDGPKLRFSVTREYVWEMGHALAKHKGKCFSPHGHNYRAEVEFSGPVKRESGMVVDFAELDKKIDPYLKEHYDHNKLPFPFHLVVSIQDFHMYIQDSIQIAIAR